MARKEYKEEGSRVVVWYNHGNHRMTMGLCVDINFQATTFATRQPCLPSLLHPRQHPHLPIRLVDSYEIVQGGSYPKAEVYKDYLVFCKDNGLAPTTAPAFGKVIRMAFPNLQCRRKGPRGEAKHHYRNFARKSKGETSSQSVLHSVAPSKVDRFVFEFFLQNDSLNF